MGSLPIPNPSPVAHQEFDLGRGRVLNQARFEAFGRSCEINVGGTMEAVQPAVAAVMLGGALQGQQRGGAQTPVGCTRVKATFTEGELIIGDGIGRTR